MEVALWLQSLAVVDRRATFTDTSTRISSMEVALWLQSVAVVDRRATFTDCVQLYSLDIAVVIVNESSNNALDANLTRVNETGVNESLLYSISTSAE